MVHNNPRLTSPCLLPLLAPCCQAVSGHLVCDAETLLQLQQQPQQLQQQQRQQQQQQQQQLGLVQAQQQLLALMLDLFGRHLTGAHWVGRRQASPRAPTPAPNPGLTPTPAPATAYGGSGGDAAHEGAVGSRYAERTAVNFVCWLRQLFRWPSMQTAEALRRCAACFSFCPSGRASRSIFQGESLAFVLSVFPSSITTLTPAWVWRGACKGRDPAAHPNTKTK